MQALRYLAKAVLVLVVLLPFLSTSAAAPQFELTIENIMRGPGLVGYEPRQVRWSGDAQRLYFEWKQPGDPILADTDTYVINRDGSGLRKLTEQEERLAPPAGGNFSPDKSKVAYAREGDLYLYDFAKDEGQRLTRTSDSEANPRFLRDGQRISFVRANNLYVLSLETGAVSQITNIRTAGPQPGAQPGPPAAATTDEDRKGTESQELLKKDEKDLLDIVRQRAAKKDADDARRAADNWWKKPLTLRSGQSINAMQLTPDEKYIVASLVDRGEGAQRTVVPNYISQAGYSETIPSRTKVGDTQDRSHLAIINAATGEMKMINHGLIAPQPIADNPGEQQATREARTTENREGQQEMRGRTGDRNREREVTCTLPLWSEDGTKAVIVGRAADNKDAWIMTLDVATATAKPIVALHDDAWIGGPGTPSIGEGGFGGGGGGGATVGWLKDDRTLYFQSEKSGYSHLYTIPYTGGEPKQLTSGNWEVLRTRLSQDKSTFYLETSEVDRGEHQFYRMSAEGGERVRLTKETGFHQAVLSRDEKYFADLYSYTTKPTELYVQENRPGPELRQLTTSPTPEFLSHKWIDPQNLHITARDGAKIPAQLFKPAKAKKGGPAVIWVHGAGYAQAVHRGWNSYYREYMFHNLLVEKGYTVLLLDYRASAGSGREWRTAVYRHMGGKDLDDNVDAARWLVKEQGVDPKRIGIYGGSYGGFLTLMALFKEPDVFAAGAALRPVTDWAHYNHSYTSSILNNPQKDAEAYQQSSPIYFAQNLKGALLICHGIVDTNVHFQDTVRLVQKLIELKKDNWSVAMYPVEDHGFIQSTSWIDEYKRIFNLFETNLKAKRG